MSDIFIDASHFAQADHLCEIISSRKLVVTAAKNIAADALGGTLVFSAAQEKAMGGHQGLIAFARSLKPKLVTIIDSRQIALQSNPLWAVKLFAFPCRAMTALPSLLPQT